MASTKNYGEVIKEVEIPNASSNTKTYHKIDSASVDGHIVESTGVESDTTTIPTTAQVKEFVNKNITSEGTTKSAVAYQDNVSANACPYALLNKVGGMSYKSENLANTSLFELGAINTASPNIGDDLENDNRSRSNYIEVKPNTQYTLKWNNNNVNYFFYDENKVCTLKGIGGTFTTSSNTKYVRFYADLITETTQIMLNTGSTALPYQPYFEGIRDSAVISVISKDSNDTSLQIINIPQDIQALEGYGWGINDTCYNYIDLANKKFIQKVGRVKISDIETINYNSTYQVFYFYITTKKQGSVLMANFTTVDTAYQQMNNMEISGTSSANGINVKDTSCVDVNAFRTKYNNYYLYYELATPIETDISQYINDNSIQISANGTITFDNTYQQAIPYEYLYDIGIIPIVDEKLTNYLSKAKITLNGTTLTINLD